MYGDTIEITYNDSTKEKRKYMESKKGLYARAEYQVHDLTLREKKHKVYSTLLSISGCIAVAILGAQTLLPFSFFSAEVGSIVLGYIAFAGISSLVEGVIASDCHNKQYNITENVIELDEMIEKQPGCFLTHYFFYGKDLSHEKGTASFAALKVEINSEIFRTLVDNIGVRINDVEDKLAKRNEFANSNTVNNIEEVGFEMITDKSKEKVLKRY